MLNPLKNQIDLYLEIPFIKSPIKVSLTFLATLQETETPSFFRERSDLQLKDIFSSNTKPWQSERTSVKKNSRSLDSKRKINQFGNFVAEETANQNKITKYFTPLSLTNNQSSIQALENLLKYSLIDKKIEMLQNKNHFKPKANMVFDLKKIGDQTIFSKNKMTFQNLKSKMKKQLNLESKLKKKHLKMKAKKKMKKMKKKISFSKVSKKVEEMDNIENDLAFSFKKNNSKLKFGFIDSFQPKIGEYKKSKLIVTKLYFYFN